MHAHTRIRGIWGIRDIRTSGASGAFRTSGASGAFRAYFVHLNERDLCGVWLSGSFQCRCNDGFELQGQFACVNVDECALGLAPCDRECEDTQGSYVCFCPEAGLVLDADGFTCNDINECLTPAIHQCSDVCVNTVGSFECACDGDRVLLSDQRTCTDTNACAVNNGDCNQVCNNDVSSGGLVSAVCSCNPGYELTGDQQTCVDIDECLQGISGCDVQCTNTLGSFVCSCNAGFSLNADARTCSDFNECASRADNNCQQQCTNQQGTFVCSCLPGYAINVLRPNRCEAQVLAMALVLSGDFVAFTSTGFEAARTLVCNEILRLIILRNAILVFRTNTFVCTIR